MARHLRCPCLGWDDIRTRAALPPGADFREAAICRHHAHELIESHSAAMLQNQTIAPISPSAITITAGQFDGWIGIGTERRLTHDERCLRSLGRPLASGLRGRRGKPQSGRVSERLETVIAHKEQKENIKIAAHPQAAARPGVCGARRAKSLLTLGANPESLNVEAPRRHHLA